MLCNLIWVALFLSWKLHFVNIISPFKTMNKFPWLLESLSKVAMKRLRFIMNGSSNLSIFFNIKRMIAC